MRPCCLLAVMLLTVVSQDKAQDRRFSGARETSATKRESIFFSVLIHNVAFVCIYAPIGHMNIMNCLESFSC